MNALPDNAFRIPTRGLTRGLTALLAVGLALAGMVLMPGIAQAASSTAPLAPGQPTTLSFPVAGQSAALTFSATSGQKFGLSVSAVAVTASLGGGFMDFTLQRPDGSALGTYPQSTPGPPTTVLLDATGTWTLLVAPESDGTGSVTFTAEPFSDQVVNVTAGKAVNVTYPGTGAGVQLKVAAKKGQRLTLGATASALTGNWASPPTVTASLVDPTGKARSGQLGQISGPAYEETGSYDDNFVLDTTGTWTVQLTPEADTAGSQTLKVGLVTDTTAATTLGTQVTFTAATPGQNARYTFAGKQGQLLEGLVGSSSFTSGSDGAPTNVAGFRANVFDPQGRFVDFLFQVGDPYGELTLPSTGTYTVVLDPNQDSLGTAKVTLRLPATATAKLAAGTGTTATIVRGNLANYTFSAVKGHRFTANFTKLVASPTGSSPALTVHLYRPGGAEFAQGHIVRPDIFETAPLDSTGTWTFSLDPDGADAGAYTFVARQTYDQTGTLTPGKSLTTTISQPGQQARYTFAGTAGQFPVIDATKTKWASADGTPWTTTFTLYRPDGSVYALFADPQPYPNPTSTSTRAVLEPNSPNSADGSLDVTGTWTLVVDPPSNAVGAETYTLNELKTQP